MSKEKQESRGQYINNIDAFLKWNEVNAFLTTELTHGEDARKARTLEALQNLNRLVDQILIMEHNNG